MAFKKGNTEGKGRVSGSQNKFSVQFKDLLTETYLALETQKGYGLEQWAKENQTEFYKIVSKLIPVQLTGAGGKDLSINLVLPEGKQRAEDIQLLKQA